MAPIPFRDYGLGRGGVRQVKKSRTDYGTRLGSSYCRRSGNPDHSHRRDEPTVTRRLSVKFLDGNCLEATDHRLKVLRGTRAGALPGKSLVVFDPALGIALDVFPCEEGHAQERSLLSAVADTVQEADLWVMDRNFSTCTINLSCFKPP